MLNEMPLAFEVTLGFVIIIGSKLAGHANGLNNVYLLHMPEQCKCMDVLYCMHEHTQTLLISNIIICSLTV